MAWTSRCQCQAGRDFLILKLCLYHRCSSLTKVNALLREQLDQANEANQALTESLHKAQEEAKQREAQQKKEQEVSWKEEGKICFVCFLTSSTVQGKSFLNPT